MIRSVIALCIFLMELAEAPKPFVHLKVGGGFPEVEVSFLGTASHQLLRLAFFFGVYILPVVVLAVIVVAILGRLVSRRLRNSRHALFLRLYKARWSYIVYAAFAYGVWYLAVDNAGVIGYQWMSCVALWATIGYGASMIVKDIWHMFDHSPKKVEKAAAALSRISLIEFRRWKNGTAHVFIDGAEIQPERSLRVKDHGASGFEWGYGGPGPSQLALALMLEAGLSDKEALKRYQSFKSEWIAKLGWEGRIWGTDVHQWLRRQRRLRWLGWLGQLGRKGQLRAKTA